MFSKLALKNVTRNLKRLLGLLPSPSPSALHLLRLLNSWSPKWVMEAPCRASYEVQVILDATLMLVRNIFSVFVSVILAFLILYANTSCSWRERNWAPICFWASH